MPQAIPVMVKRLRSGLRPSAAQASRKISKNIALTSRLKPQSFNGIDRSRAIRGIQCREHSNQSQQEDRARAQLPTRQQSSKKLRHGQQIDQRAKTVRDDQPGAAAQRDDDHSFQKELP